MLLERFQQRFGDHLPLIRRSDVKGFTIHKPFWLRSNLQLKTARNAAAIMELETMRFYEAAAEKTQDIATRQLLAISRRSSASTAAWPALCRRKALPKPSARRRTKPSGAFRAADRAARPRGGLWMAPSLRSRRFSPRLLPPTAATMRSSSGLPPPRARASAWASPRRFRMTVRLAAGASVAAREYLRGHDGAGRPRP